MSVMSLLVFSLVALLAIVTPGPTVLLALTNGSRYGVRRSVPGMLGAVASDFVLVGAVALGLGALLAASEFWFSVVKWVGAVTNPKGYLFCSALLPSSSTRQHLSGRSTSSSASSLRASTSP